MKKLIVVFCILAISCQEDEHTCYTGTVLGYEPCRMVSIIALKGVGFVGKPLTWEDTLYKHVIKVPGIYEKGTLYFSMREYNKTTDEHLLIAPQLCAMYDPVNIPMFTIIASSNQHCP